MKNTFKRIIFTTLVALTQINNTQAKTVDSQLIEMHSKIQNLHTGFELILLKGEKEGHPILLSIQAICSNEENSHVGKLLNELVKKLNAIFKTVHHIVSKYSKKGPGSFAPFLFEIGKSCNLEDLFKTTIYDLQEIQKLLDSVNDCHITKEELNKFIDFLKKIQPIWHEALLQKELIIKNLRKSL